MRLSLTSITHYLCVFFCLFLLGCGDDSFNVQQDDAEVAQQEMVDTLFSASVQNLNIDVFYEPGAGPYVGSLGLFGKDTWEITKDSYEELFSKFTDRNINVPKELSEMTEISAQERTLWSVEQLRNLGDEYASSFSSNENDLHLSVIFVKGSFESNSNIIGVHLTGRPYSFIFKDVVISAGGNSNQQKYIEQTVVVHELGHSVGLVNNGLSLSQDHEDPEHSKHTLNDQCAMYWAVKTSNNILDFVIEVIAANRTQLFGSESLSDAQ